MRDLVIEGISPTDEPFIRAREIDVAMPLWSLLRRQLTITNVTMTDWQMKVETFPGGRHTFPKFASNNPSGRPSPIKVSVSYVHAVRGQFTYEDHGTPWSTVVRNLDVTVLKLVGYRGYSTSSGGLVTVQKYVPMGADLRTWFRIEDGKILLDRIELDTDGAKTLCTGVVDSRHWPEQTYNVDSTIQLPRMREIWWANETLLAGRAGALQGPLPHLQGRPRAEGRLLERRGRPQPVPVPAAARVAGLDARSVRGEAGAVAVLRRHGGLHVPDVPARASRSRPRRGST